MRGALGTLLLCAFGAAAQEGQVTIGSEVVGDGLVVLTGRGGNMLLCHGEDGSFLVDDQFAPLSEAIQAKITELGAPPVRFVLNTHYHDDHTGGNENFGESGATVVAHDNVRERMTMEFRDIVLGQLRTPAAEGRLPVVTFNDEVRFHLNGHEILATHVAAAHTDGDAIVHFAEANVLHTGDIYFNGLYPYVDVTSGGRVTGVIDAVGAMLELCDDATVIVPGHGPVAGRSDLEAYRAMLIDVQGKVRAMLAEGASVDDVVAAKLAADYEAEWGQIWLNGDQFTRMIALSEQAE